MSLRVWIYIIKKLTNPVNLKGMIRFVCRVKNWSSLVAILVLNRPARVKIGIAGTVFTFDPVSLENFSSMYEVFGKEVYRMESDAKTILDLGAYQGYYSFYAYAKYPSSVIYTYEPFPGNYESIRRNIRDNNLDPNRIKPFDAAISDTVGTTSFYVNAASKMDSSIIYKDGTRIDVPSITIGEIMRTHRLDKIDVLKIDIEGSEYGAFRGLGDELLSKIENIAAEIHPVEGEKVWDLVEFLKGKGFFLKSRDESGREYLFSRKA